MPRAIDEQRRTDLVGQCLPYVAEHGVAQLSLRPLAAALGTTDRMLIHYFGTKEALIGRVLAETRPDVSGLVARAGDDPAALARALWRELSRPGAQQVRIRVLLEVMALALTRPDPYREYARAAVEDWVAPLARALRASLPVTAAAATARATALVSGIRGVALDRYLTGDVARTDRAARLIIDAATLA